MKSLMKSLLYFSVAAITVAVLLGAAFHSDVAVAAMPGVHLAALDPSALLFAGAGYTIQQLREKRTGLVNEARNLHEKMGEKPDAAQVKSYDEKLDEIERLDGTIKREQQLLDLSAEKHFKAAGGQERDLPEGQRTLKAIHAKWVRGGDKALSAEDWATVRNTLSTTTDSEGGYTVQDEPIRELVRSMKAYGGMREAADVFSTSTGAALPYPTNDATAEEGELIAENTTATAADPTFSTVSLAAYKYSSKVIAVPFELLQDSQFDIEAFVRALFAERLGRITNKHFTTGTGTSQPRGIITGSSEGKAGATGQVTTILYDDVVDLFHSVNRAYRSAPGAGFMTADAGVKMLRKVKDGNSRPIFVPGYETSIPGAAGSAPDMLLGTPLHVNDDIAAPAASAKSLIYGDLKKYKIRDVMSLTMFRFTDSAYAKLGQVGFLAWMRTGGNLVDTAAVKHYVHPAS